MTRCRNCAARLSDDFGPEYVTRVRIEVSIASRKDLSQPFSQFPEVRLVDWEAVVCSHCADIAADTASAFERARRERAGEPAVPQARVVSRFRDRVRRAAQILLGAAS